MFRVCLTRGFPPSVAVPLVICGRPFRARTGALDLRWESGILHIDFVDDDVIKQIFGFAGVMNAVKRSGLLYETVTRTGFEHLSIAMDGGMP